LKVYSYVLDHDFGFAPNPFFGVCTLATCKPKIRDRATRGDWIVGTGCAKRKRRGKLVYYMRVGDVITYDQYWNDPRFRSKRPRLNGNKMQAFGDNIYRRSPTGEWLQENSFHSLPHGPNPLNVNHDTGSERVLIGSEFAYWGGSGPTIPQEFRDWNGDDICAGRFHRVNFAEGLAEAFLEWARSQGQRGQIGTPADWPRSG